MENKSNILQRLKSVKGLTDTVLSKRPKNAFSMKQGSTKWITKLKQDIHSVRAFIQAHSL